VATNRWNLRLAMKKITSGPSSVASLNSGCGVVLSIIPFRRIRRIVILRDGASHLLRMRILRLFFPHPLDEDNASGLPSSQSFTPGKRASSMRLAGCSLFNPRDGPRELVRGERREIVDALADTDEVHRQFVLFGQ